VRLNTGLYKSVKSLNCAARALSRAQTGTGQPVGSFSLEDIMSEMMIVEAELREETGRSAARRMRRAGKIPGIIYGGDKPDLPISIEYFVISKLMDIEHFHTSMLEVKVKGSRGKNTVLLKDAQYDPVKDTVSHIDFFRVSASDKVEVEVPVEAINGEKCPGVVAGGMLQTVRHHLEISCRADSIPDNIIVDCSKLEIGDNVHIRDITLPEGVTVPELEEGGEEHNFTLVACIPPIVELAPAEDEEVEGEEGSEADETAAEGEAEEAEEKE